MCQISLLFEEKDARLVGKAGSSKFLECRPVQCEQRMSVFHLIGLADRGMSSRCWSNFTESCTHGNTAKGVTDDRIWRSRPIGCCSSCGEEEAVATGGGGGREEGSPARARTCRQPTPPAATSLRSAWR